MVKIRTIYLAGDHAGFRLKKRIVPFLVKKGYIVVDLGPYEYSPKDDYPDFVIPLAKKVSKDTSSMGLVIAGSGQGEVIATNKIKGIRAGLYHGGSTKIVRTGRAHDDINVLCMGSRFVTEKEAKRAINTFLKTKFERGRHLRRLKKIYALEK